LHDSWTFIDPRPECNHSLHFAYGGSSFCMDCGTDVTEHESGRTMYRPLGAK
jgi:hypothetical protein